MVKDKKKLKITIISLCVFLLVLAGVGITGFYIAGDYLFKTLLESYVEEQITNQLEASIDSMIAEDEELQTADAQGTEREPGQTADAQGTEAGQTTAGTNGQAGEGTPGEKPKAKKMTKEEIKQVVKEKTEAINDAIPSKDKLAISQLIFGNLTPEDIRYLTSLAADGISKEDMAEAKKIAKARFTEEQMKDVQAYYKQYADVVLEK